MNNFKYITGGAGKMTSFVHNKCDRYVAVLWVRKAVVGTVARVDVGVPKPTNPEPEYLHIFAPTLWVLNDRIKEHMTSNEYSMCDLVCAYETVRSLKCEHKTETEVIVKSKWTEVS